MKMNDTRVAQINPSVIHIISRYIVPSQVYLKIAITNADTVIARSSDQDDAEEETAFLVFPNLQTYLRLAP